MSSQYSRLGPKPGNGSLWVESYSLTSGTTIALPADPSLILLVTRNGYAQFPVTHYTVSGYTLTFSTAFNNTEGPDLVIVVFAKNFQTNNASTVNGYGASTVSAVNRILALDASGHFKPHGYLYPGDGAAQQSTRYLRDTGTTLSINDRLYVGASPADPGANNLRVQGNAGFSTALDAVGSLYPTLQLGPFTTLHSHTSTIFSAYINNAYFNGTSYISRAAGASQMIRMISDNMEFAFAPNSPAGAGQTRTFTNRAIFYASGGVYIGDTATDPGVNNLQVQGRFFAGTNGGATYAGVVPRIETYFTSLGPADNDGGHEALYGTSSFASNIGSRTVWGGKYNTAGNYASFGGIGAYKENATDGNYAGYAAISTRANGGGMTEKLRVGSSGQTTITHSGAAHVVNSYILTLNGGVGSAVAASFTKQTTTNVSTSAVKIFDAGSYGGMIIVTGASSGSLNIFCDHVLTGYGSTSPISIMHSMTSFNTPAARTYSRPAAGDLSLAMGSGTYGIHCVTLMCDYFTP